MINIITKPDNKEYTYFFNDCESFFKAKIHSNVFGDNDINAMLSVDKAILLDKNTGIVKTDFGVTHIDCLSSGCKVVLIYLYILRNKESYDGSILLDVTECGSNALDVLFDLVEKFGGDLEITFLLRHRNDLFKCKSRNYVVDGRSKKKLF